MAIETDRLYDRDFVEWTKHTAENLREGRISACDIALVAEEIEDMGKRDQRSARSNLRILLHHLLKWKLQPGKRSTSWRASIVEHRRRLHDLFLQSPSLRNHVFSGLNEVYRDALTDVEVETGLKAIPERCPWQITEILRPDFFPD
ncbi:MAG: DUF29 domain-containing protein [Acidobacteriia bacterium]|nr:DUF29 domain-containing protein [Terriglobia bacterium]